MENEVSRKDDRPERRGATSFEHLDLTTPESITRLPVCESIHSRGCFLSPALENPGTEKEGKLKRKDEHFKEQICEGYPSWLLGIFRQLECR